MKPPIDLEERVRVRTGSVREFDGTLSEMSSELSKKQLLQATLPIMWDLVGANKDIITIERFLVKIESLLKQP